MYRRTLLASLGVGVVGTIAGCAGNQDSGSVNSTTANGNTSTRTSTPKSTREDVETTTPERLTEIGVHNLPIKLSEMTVAAPDGTIPAIIDPQFDSSWDGIAIELDDDENQVIRPRLSPDEGVIGVEMGCRARAYPLRMLVWHEVVNDTFDEPLLISYCPLCASAMTANRRIGDTVTTFDVSGRLWQSNLVLKDQAFNSYWSQLYATAINGPALGRQLEIVPSSLTTWESFRSANPDAQVLLPAPISGTTAGEIRFDYTREVVAGFDRTRTNDQPANTDGLHPKTIVLGIVKPDGIRAYPLPAVHEAGVINDWVGSTPVVVTVAPDDSLFGYVRRVDGQTLTFRASGPRHLRAGGSRWDRVTGKATAGPHEGQRLDQASELSPLFWFVWKSQYPQTTVYGRDQGTETSKTTTSSQSVGSAIDRPG